VENRVGERGFGAGRGVGKELMYWFQEPAPTMMLAWGAISWADVCFDALVFAALGKPGFFWRQITQREGYVASSGGDRRSEKNVSKPQRCSANLPLSSL